MVEVSHIYHIYLYDHAYGLTFPSSFTLGAPHAYHTCSNNRDEQGC
jgi:hypothetical protein